MTAVVETPCSRNRPSWPIRPGTKGILLMASVSATMEKALPEKMSRAGISVVLFERVARRQRAMMVSAASSPSAVVCSPPVIPARQNQLGGVDLGEAHDGHPLGIGRRGIDGVVENAGGDLGAVDGGGIELLVSAARGRFCRGRRRSRRPPAARRGSGGRSCHRPRPARLEIDRPAGDGAVGIAHGPAGPLPEVQRRDRGTGWITAGQRQPADGNDVLVGALLEQGSNRHVALRWSLGSEGRRSVGGGAGDRSGSSVWFFVIRSAQQRWGPDADHTRAPDQHVSRAGRSSSATHLRRRVEGWRPRRSLSLGKGVGQGHALSHRDSFVPPSAPK